MADAIKDPRLARRDTRVLTSIERTKQEYLDLGQQLISQADPYSTSMQTAYQHLQPTMYSDVSIYA